MILTIIIVIVFIASFTLATIEFAKELKRDRSEPIRVFIIVFVFCFLIGSFFGLIANDFIKLACNESTVEITTFEAKVTKVERGSSYGDTFFVSVVGDDDFTKEFVVDHDVYARLEVGDIVTVEKKIIDNNLLEDTTYYELAN